VKRIYDAANLPEANLLADRLRACGIDVHILNASAAGALGDVPMMDALPQLWLRNPAHAALARSMIAAYHAVQIDDHSNWRCPSCAEDNPGTFDICWQCGATASEQAS
jgi:hypothetical protein